MGDVLFDFEAQFREKRTLWRIFELAPIRLRLAHGRIFRWFGINIPLSLVELEGDIDLLMALRDVPRRQSKKIYEALEVKAVLISREGRARSLKASASKTRQLAGQLTKYRKIGAPSVSLLEIYVCEDGFFETQRSLPREVLAAISEKHRVAARNRFGHSMIFMQHDARLEREDDLSSYLGLRVRGAGDVSVDPIICGTRPMVTAARSPFIELAATLETFVEREIESGTTTLGKCIVTYCYRCRRLITVDHRRKYSCRYCGDALAVQTA